MLFKYREMQILPGNYISGEREKESPGKDKSL